MRQYILDGITAQYLIDSGVSSSMRLSNYQPGGDRFTDAEALRWFIINEIGLSVSMDQRVHINDSQITIYTGWDSISADTMRVLLDAELVHSGRRYVFCNITCDAETYVEYGSEGLNRWMEVTFKRI